MKKTVLVLSLIVSTGVFSQAMMAKPKDKLPIKVDQKEAKTAQAPCADSKEDVLKKLEEKKKEQAGSGKGFSLQGSTDTGCSLK